MNTPAAEKSIYDQFVEARCEIANHESDLYVKVDRTSTRILRGYHFLSNVKTFVSQIDGKLWYDIPFAYMPFWESRQRP